VLAQYADLATRECWLGVLASSIVGLAVSIFAVGRDEKDSYYSRYGFEFSLSILGGRAFEPRPKPTLLPLLPKAILMSLLSSIAIFFLLLRSNCPQFLDDHWLFSVLWVVCALSTSVWLRKASTFQEKAQAAESLRVEEFLSNSAAPVPSGPERIPMTLALWNYSNITLFGGLVLAAASFLWRVI
jgi:hypothetical protein